MPKSISKYKILLYSLGDPSGIGPEILIKSLSDKDILNSAIHLAVADSRLLSKTVSTLGVDIPLNPIDSFDVQLLKAGILNVLNIPNADKVKLAKPNLESAKASLEYLDKASKLIEDFGSDISSLITLPVSKEAISSLGLNFKGHTEYLKDRFKVDSALMIFLTPLFSLYLATRHIPLREVADSIDAVKLKSAIREIDAFFSKVNKSEPKIAFLGLNPHSGEHGMIGSEEISIINPLIEELRTDGLDIYGPYPSDGFFRNKDRFEYDIVISLYHDQTLPVIKALFDNTVNFTLGLPFLRFSPDHGPAYDIAGKGIANPASLIKAIEYSLTLDAS